MTDKSVWSSRSGSLMGWIQVPKNSLHITAGLMWSAVGLVLFSYIPEWLAPLPKGESLWYIAFGLVLAGLIAVFGFSRLAAKNIQRIHNLPGTKQSLLLFQKWTSYPLILVMISMGIYLRKYSPIPGSYLAVIYLGIGGGLFISSFQYYLVIWKERLNN